MHTELRIEGADCPFCINSTVDALGSLDGVRQVSVSSVAGCLAIDHDDLDVAALIGVVRDRLHGVAMAGAEIVMVSVEPLVVDLHCAHGAAHDS